MLTYIVQLVEPVINPHLNIHAANLVHFVNTRFFFPTNGLKKVVMENAALNLLQGEEQPSQVTVSEPNQSQNLVQGAEVGEENKASTFDLKTDADMNTTEESNGNEKSTSIVPTTESHNGINGTASNVLNSSTSMEDAQNEGSDNNNAKEKILPSNQADQEGLESKQIKLENGSESSTSGVGEEIHVANDSHDNHNNDNNSNNNKKRSTTLESDNSKKRKQSKLNFSSSKGHMSLSLSAGEANNEDESEHMNDTQDLKQDDNEDTSQIKNEEGEFMVKLAYKKSEEPPKKRRGRKPKDQTQEKLRNFERAAKKPLPKTKPLNLPLAKVRKSSGRSKQAPSPTTILRENNRNARPLPGPLVPLHYTLYDGNVINSENNKVAAEQKLAFGFPVKHNPNLYDIMYILLFLSKFDPVVQAGPLGPDDFEQGLDLDNELKRPMISQTMEVFFRRLLVLLLNRKKAIPKEGQRPAIQELQAKYSTFGLPEEWRDDSLIHEVDSFPCVPADDVVDPSKPPVAPEDLLEYEGPKELPNPFHSKEFEEYGLAGIESPRQRVILLRTMVVWCLSVSLRVKTHLTSVVSKQEVPGERDNLYVSRAVMKGFANTLESKKDHEVKVARKTKPTSKGGMQDFDLRLAYMDPTSNPMTHPLALRLNEFVIGDLGFHIGRFYLVRTADASAGGLGALDKMKNAAKLGPGDRSMSTNFRLYVEDVHSVLDSCLRVDGVEFDSNGDEVTHDVKYDDTKYWYTVASNYDELQAFTDLIELKLGTKTTPGEIAHGSDAYRPLLFMYQYLCHVTPIIGELEGLFAGGNGATRATRKKAIDYSAGPAWDEELDEYSEKRGDDDYSEDGEGGEEGEEGFEEEDEEEDEEEEEEAEFLD